MVSDSDYFLLPCLAVYYRVSNGLTDEIRVMQYENYICGDLLTNGTTNFVQR